MFTKKRLIWLIISIAIAVLVIWAVFSQAGDMSIEELFSILLKANPVWLIGGVLCMTGFIFFEGQAVLCIIKHIGYKRGQGRGFIYGSGDVFFSAITPSASGGQPACAYFMVKDGIPMTVVTVVLMLNLIMYNLAIIVVAAFILITTPGLFLGFSFLSKLLFIVGLGVIIFLVFLFYMLLAKGQILFNACHKILNFLKKIHIMKEETVVNLQERLKSAISDYQQCVKMVAGQKGMLIKAFLFNLAQRVSQIMVTVMMYMATGGSGSRALEMFNTQGFVAIGSNCIPIPGAMGVSDYIMVDGFKNIVGQDFAYKLELLSRSLSFYICIIVSGLTVVIAYLMLKRRKKREE